MVRVLWLFLLLVGSWSPIALATTPAAQVRSFSAEPEAADLTNRHAMIQAVQAFLSTVPPTREDEVELRWDYLSDGNFNRVRGAASIRIRASLQAVMGPLTRYERWPGILRKINNDAIMGPLDLHFMAGDRAELTMRIVLPWYVRAIGLPFSWCRMVVWALSSPGVDGTWAVTWRHLEGNVGASTGVWWLEPCSGGFYRLTYYIEADMNTLQKKLPGIPSSLAARAVSHLLETSMVGAVASIRREAEQPGMREERGP